MKAALPFWMHFITFFTFVAALAATSHSLADPRAMRDGTIGGAKPFERSSVIARQSASRGGSAESVNERNFHGFDLDGDGRVSKAEAAGYADLINGFDRADRNRDGKLTLGEYEALLKRHARDQARAEARAAKKEQASAGGSAKKPAHAPR
jgi:hypothetical protein